MAEEIEPKHFAKTGNVYDGEFGKMASQDALNCPVNLSQGNKADWYRERQWNDKARDVQRRKSGNFQKGVIF